MKPNNNNNQRQRQQGRPNYFQQNVQKLGIDFLDRKTARDLQLDSIRVFRDLARGNVNVETDGQYFLHPQFLESCITAAYSKLIFHKTNCDGVTLLVNAGANDPTTMSILDANRRCMEAYNIIYTQLNNIKITKDVNYLSAMVNNLKGYRNNI